MTYTFEEAKADFSSRTTLQGIIDLVRLTAAIVEGAPENATSLLYDGEVFGQDSFQVSKALVASTVGEVEIKSGQRRVIEYFLIPIRMPGSEVLREDGAYIVLSR
jgi:hypothetical protein